MPAATLEIAPPESVYRFLRDHPEYGGASKERNYYRLAETQRGLRPQPNGAGPSPARSGVRTRRLCCGRALPGNRREPLRNRPFVVRRRADLVVHAAPVQIRFEPHAACNLRCCWAQRNPKHPGLRPRGAADVDLARRIIDQIGDCLYAVNLHHWGEPTLNPHLSALVRVFHDADIHTSFHTNMTLMTAELAGALVGAGLDAVSGSIDGVSQATYERYRINGNVDRAISGLRHLAEQRRRLGRTNPQIRWQYLVFPHNEHEVEAARQLANEIGMDVFDAFGGSGRCWTPEEGFKPLQTPPRPAGLLCEDPWHGLAVDWDGAIHLCCRAFQARHVMGHLDENDLRTIFDNERFQLARRVIRDGWWEESDGPIPCTGCNKVKQFVPAIASLNHTLTPEPVPLAKA